tara:strand:- start:6747 stop:7235 length:489 start_codon:yes stop_codon:yes gene_type:complete
MQAGRSHGLTDEEVICIFAYTMPNPASGRSVYQALNTALRYPLSHEAAHMKPMASLLLKAMSKLAPVDGPLVRRTTIPPDVMHDAKLYARFCDPAFISFSKDPNLDPFGKDLLVVRSTRARNISDLSYFSSEWEALYPPATPFQVSSLVDEASGAILILNEV